jgi:hypothetical protein
MRNSLSKTKQEGSYTMLLSMLLAFFLICLFIFRQDIFNGGKKEPTIFEKGTNAIEQAKEVTHAQDMQTQQTNALIDN